MGIVQVIKGSVSDTLNSQWKEVVTVGEFEEDRAVSPGYILYGNNGKDKKYKKEIGYLTSGSKILVPLNTAAFIFTNGGVEEVIAEPGAYIYEGGEKSVFNKDGFANSILNQLSEKIAFGGNTPTSTKIAFLNLREIRNIKFGTRSPIIYNDIFYKTDLEVIARGSYSIKINDPATFIYNFLPANSASFSFGDFNARSQINSEFIQSFAACINSFSKDFRVSELPSKTKDIVDLILQDESYAGSWLNRFGFELVNIGIDSIDFSENSKILVNKFSENRLDILSYENMTRESSEIRYQQKIAEGMKDHGMGNGAEMIFAMNMMGNQANNVREVPEEKNTSISIDQQIELLTKLKKLVDDGILTEEEFGLKKKEILGL